MISKNSVIKPMYTVDAKRFSYLIIFFLLIFTNISEGQERNYTQYDVNNGLAGSTVYCMAQDSDGFVWFGTETGLSRFDGTHFKNFGIADGLPDNEILQMFRDSKGRIWMAPFKKTVCYYYKGKFHNSTNDSLLMNFKFKSHVLDFAEDIEGNILFEENDQLHLLTEHGIKLITTIDGKPISDCIAISGGLTGGFLLILGDKVYELKNEQFHLLLSPSIISFSYKDVGLSKYLLAIKYFNIETVTKLRDTSRVTVRLAEQPDNLQVFGDSLLISNSQDGAHFYYLNSRNPERHYLKNKSVSRSFIDDEGNIWFSTLGEGVFRLASENMSSLKLVDKKGRQSGAYIVRAEHGHWIVGGSKMQVFTISPASDTMKVSLIWNEFGSNPSSRSTAVARYNKSSYLFGSDMQLEKIPQTSPYKYKWPMAVKSIARKSGNELLVASNRNVISITVPELVVKDTFWNQRATTVYYYDDTVFVGTLDGLFLVSKNKMGLYAGDRDPILKNRINAMCASPNGTLWIGTDGAGVLAYRKGTIIKTLNLDNGISSNNCRTLWASDDELWIGTDKGLNRVSLSPGEMRIMHLTQGDGLSSNLINSVDLDGDTVVVASPAGIDFFDKNQLSFRSHCNLIMDKVVVSNRELPTHDQHISLVHNDNNIRFDYAGISFRSGGEIVYQYRLVGLDTNWKQTKENFLDYPSLPSGQYKLQLRAVNKFGIASNLFTYSFTVEQLLTETNWFRVAIMLVVIALAALIVFLVVRRAKRKEGERNQTRNRIAELEQLALKSQMNPHFIFNCLNSIQQYVLDKDVAGSNKFITEFSRLVRQTLDISARKEIALGEEITYLSTYLELERMRFEGKFAFEVLCVNGLDKNEYFIPPMMLQPFVENSIRHGIRYRKDNEGKIVISFDKSDTELICVVEDNGIGRKEALRLKSRSPIEYQSKGMSLIASRIKYLNRDAAVAITLDIEDLYDADQHSTGTRVVMRFPLQYIHA